MKYADLIEAMHKFRTEKITRNEMITAIALWQRPVECASPENKRAAVEHIIHA